MWHSQNSGTTESLDDVAWSGQQFVVVGTLSPPGTILTSPDGFTWTPQNTGTFVSSCLFGYTKGLKPVMVRRSPFKILPHTYVLCAIICP